MQVGADKGLERVGTQARAKRLELRPIPGERAIPIEMGVFPRRPALCPQPEVPREESHLCSLRAAPGWRPEGVACRAKSPIVAGHLRRGEAAAGQSETQPAWGGRYDGVPVALHGTNGRLR